MTSICATVHALVERNARQRPDGVYAVDGEGQHPLRFADLARSCQEVAGVLQAHGLRPGQTVSDPHQERAF